MCVVVSMVVFRAPILAAAGNILSGMFSVVNISQIGTAAPAIVPRGQLVRWLLALLGTALILPNSLQLLRAFEPPLGWKPTAIDTSLRASVSSWTPSLAWAVAMSVILTIDVLHLGVASEFLYWQF